MAALTLIEASKLYAQRGEDFRAAIVEMFASSNPIMMNMPFETIQGTALAFSREASLPGIAFRGVNESFTPSAGVVQNLTEALCLGGGAVDVDRFIVENLGESARATHERMKIKALTQDFMRAFFKGDSSSNNKEFDGLQKRLTGNQVISNKRAASPAGGEVLSLAKLDEAIDAVYNPTHILMNKALKRRLKAAARATGVSGTINFDVNEMGAEIMFYNGLPVVAIEDANGGDTILPFSEAASDAGGSSVNTSIYIVSFGPMMLTGIQGAAQLVPTDIGKLESGAAYRTLVDWDVSFVLWHGRAAARLRDIIDGACVA
jgi:hypothetical protein